MFNSLTRGVYEIEPAGKTAEGILQSAEYAGALQWASDQGLLQGVTPIGTPYNWNACTGCAIASFHPGLGIVGIDWPGKLRQPLPGVRGYELVADYWNFGVVLYWLECDPRVPHPVWLPYPYSRRVKDRDWDPRLNPPARWGLTLRPAPVSAHVISAREGCGYIVIGVAAIPIALNIATDISTGGLGDPVTMPPLQNLLEYGRSLVNAVATQGP